MVRQIIWTERAEKVFSSILEFYVFRNGSKTYSRKLRTEIYKAISLLKKQPFIGRKTDILDISALIKTNYHIFYKIESDSILILLVWDCRQNPNSLNIDKSGKL